VAWNIGWAFILKTTMIAVGATIGYGSPLILTDTSNKIKHIIKRDVSELKQTLLITTITKFDYVLNWVRKKVL
jgi:long-chain acyl-CoA synthetase